MSYDQFALMQRESAKILATQLTKFAPAFHPKTILDVGAGTGFVSERLFDYYPNAQFSLNDIAPGMLRIASEKLGRLGAQFNCILGDMEQINCTDHDLIISNLAFQWAHKLDELIVRLYKKSTLLAFSTLLDGSLSDWDKVLMEYKLPVVVRNYPSESSLVNLIDSLSRFNHFYIRNFQLYFTRNSVFVSHLKNTGASAANVSMPISKFKQCLGSGRPLGVTYKVFFGILGKA